MAAVGLFAFASGAHALMFKNGDAVSVPKDEIVAGSLYAYRGLGGWIKAFLISVPLSLAGLAGVVMALAQLR